MRQSKTTNYQTTMKTTEIATKFFQRWDKAHGVKHGGKMGGKQHISSLAAALEAVRSSPPQEDLFHHQGGTFSIKEDTPTMERFLGLGWKTKSEQGLRFSPMAYMTVRDLPSCAQVQLWHEQPHEGYKTFNLVTLGQFAECWEMFSRYLKGNW